MQDFILWAQAPANHPSIFTSMVGDWGWANGLRPIVVLVILFLLCVPILPGGTSVWTIINLMFLPNQIHEKLKDK